jgi:DNA end-binding protein Ku
LEEAMARSKSRTAKRKQPRDAESPPSRAIWKGSIDFGLVSIPVKLHAGVISENIDFDLLDKRDFSRVRYKRVNEKTGREVPWNEIVKGYEYRKGEYVALTDTDFERANVEATRSIAITEFVNLGDISPTYFDKPYYLEPLKNGRRAYLLLREAINHTGKAGVATVVIRSRQHLAAVMVEGPVLVLNLLRFTHELRNPAALDVPKSGEKGAAVSAQETKMAERLVESMTGEWNPEKYRDEYSEDLRKLIDRKVKSGRTKAIETEQPAERPKRDGKVIDIMHLLRESVEKVSKPTPEHAGRRRKAS